MALCIVFLWFSGGLTQDSLHFPVFEGGELGIWS